MKLSVIIVSYNVRFFLEQCLHSVMNAIKNMDAEILVADNNSADGSVAMIKEKFPEIILIENDKNLGFAVANNKAIARSSGEYILLLNPDTLVEEDTFTRSLDFMDRSPDIGALGVKLIDGKGNFLPESKRGLPTPWVAFYKIFGLSSLFPESKKFGKYHLSYLDRDKIHDVDVLCGAFMLIRKKTLEKTGLLDESFFMYGEDIDLSYRITQAGYRVVYFPETTIIHYKGESTRKGSLNYVYLFYRAMQIFARKHLTGRGAWFLNIFIQAAIFFRAFLSVIKRIALRLLLPVVDFTFMYIGIATFTRFWGQLRFGSPEYYPSEFYMLVIPGYILIWMISLLFAGSYDHSSRLKDAVSGILAGTILILVVYALLPNNYQFSRVIILSGTIWALIVSVSIRFILSFSGIRQFRIQKQKRKRIAIAGSYPECKRIGSILSKLSIQPPVAFISPGNEISPFFSGTLSRLPEIIKINQIDEVIFCSLDVPASVIIQSMLTLTDTGCDFKIAPANSDSIIGSNSINTAGDLFVYNINPVTAAKNRRLKRTFDVVITLLLIVMLPFWIGFNKRPLSTLKEMGNVLLNRKTWIGCSRCKPKMKPEIYNVTEAFPDSSYSRQMMERLEWAYLQNYSIGNDLRIFLRVFFRRR